MDMPGENILIVDDEPLICSALRRELKGAGYHVDSVLSGEDALEAVKQRRYCLALIDKNMPRMNGMEVCRRMKEISPGLIVILVTGEGAISKEELEAVGGWACLFKPFARGEVLAQVKEALGEPEAPPSGRVSS